MCAESRVWFLRGLGHTLDASKRLAFLPLPATHHSVSPITYIKRHGLIVPDKVQNSLLLSVLLLTSGPTTDEQILSDILDRDEGEWIPQIGTRAWVGIPLPTDQDSLWTDYDP
jgi:hypothetical protein